MGHGEVARIVRNKVAGELSVRVSHGSEAAIGLLLDHHRNSWVEPQLVQLWRQMGPRFAVLELWKADEIVAADFMHLDTTTRHCYVATRCHRAKFKRLGAGFLLGLISLKLLQSR